MWLAAVPIVLIVGTLIVRSRRNRARRPPTPADVEMADPPACVELLETPVCDVVGWLRDARARIDIMDEPVVERVEVGGGVATRLTFSVKGGRREIWLDGPDFLEPLPRLRDLEWDDVRSPSSFQLPATRDPHSDTCARVATGARTTQESFLREPPAQRNVPC